MIEKPKRRRHADQNTDDAPISPAKPRRTTRRAAISLEIRQLLEVSNFGNHFAVCM
jgi:hypothetical protein